MMMLLLALVVPIWSKIYVFSPEELRLDFQARYPVGDIPASLGNFGNPPYGTSLVGHLFYPENPSERNGCKPLSRINFATDPDDELINTPILLLDRGDCPFVVKVRHAEDIGVKLVIIANNVGTSPEGIIMSDNGMGGNLQIPAILITKDDGILLKKYLGNTATASKIALSVWFTMNKLSDKINYSLWTTPSSEIGRSFLMEFSKIGKIFSKEFAEFTPHYVLWYCPECKKNGFNDDNTECVSGGRYCSLDPDGSGSLSGRDVMVEIIRQICLFKQTTSSNYDKWFNYQAEYFYTCSQDLFSKSCSNKVLAKIGINEQTIENCFKESFEGKEIGLDDNKLLREEMEKLKGMNIPYYPSIVINEQIYRGDLEASAVLTALCAGYSWGTGPDLCKEKESNGNVNVPETKSNTTNIVVTVIAIIACLAVVAGILVIYKMIVKKDLNRDMKVQVNNAVAHYFQLAEIPK